MDLDGSGVEVWNRGGGAQGVWVWDVQQIWDGVWGRVLEMKGAGLLFVVGLRWVIPPPSRCITGRFITVIGKRTLLYGGTVGG